jgi:hypothetical protein
LRCRALIYTAALSNNKICEYFLGDRAALFAFIAAIASHVRLLRGLKITAFSAFIHSLDIVAPILVISTN